MQMNVLKAGRSSPFAARVKRIAALFAVVAWIAGAGLLATPTIAAEPSADIAKFVGRYKRPEAPPEAPGIRIVRDGNFLTTQMMGGDINKLQPVGENRFEVQTPGGKATFEFIVEKGVVTGLKMEQAGMDTFVLKRVPE